MPAKHSPKSKSASKQQDNEPSGGGSKTDVGSKRNALRPKPTRGPKKTG